MQFLFYAAALFYGGGDVPAPHSIPAPPAAEEKAESIYKRRPAPLLDLGQGYQDKLISKGRWRILGVSDSYVDGMVHIVLYRGALLAKAQGYSYLKVVNGRIIHNVIPQGVLRPIDLRTGRADFVMVGMTDRDQPVPCERKGKFAANCRVLEVDRLIEEMGPALQRSPEQMRGDLEEASNLALR